MLVQTCVIASPLPKNYYKMHDIKQKNLQSPKHPGGWLCFLSVSLAIISGQLSMTWPSQKPTDPPSNANPAEVPDPQGLFQASPKTQDLGAPE